MYFPGRLHFCSHSLIYVPDDSKLPIFYFAFDKFAESGIKQVQQAYLQFKAENLISFVCTQVIEMKKGNKPHAYLFRKTSEEIVFGTKFISARELITKINPVYSLWANSKKTGMNRAQVTEKLHHMYSASMSHFKVDTTWLEDFREVQLVEVFAQQVTPLVDMHGKILVTNERLYFQAFHNISSKPVKKINLRDLKRVVKRRHLLRQIGIEFITQNKSYLFTFQTMQQRDMVYNALLKQPSLNSLVVNDQGNMTIKWQHGLITNFDYLLYLNFMADRTFNDLTQYPVFPWVIADYNSATLNLNDPNTYRDLSKPIGALNPTRLKRFKDRLSQMPDPKFLYGTHYSTPGYVLYYLVRQAPEYMLKLQNGRFDAPDRSFHSLKECWYSVNNNDADVKELIPEFYQSTGDFLKNTHYDLQLGNRQNDGQKVNHVLLPAWAQDTRDFIYKNRCALESQYVSERLHLWIDLIFGYKQTGKEALQADNLFYYLTYEGAVDIEKIKNPTERQSIEMQIREFGQTPKQLFDKPHPKRIATSAPQLDKYTVTGSNNISMDPISNIATSSTLVNVSSPLLSNNSSGGSNSPVNMSNSAFYNSIVGNNNNLSPVIARLNSGNRLNSPSSTYSPSTATKLESIDALFEKVMANQPSPAPQAYVSATADDDDNHGNNNNDDEDEEDDDHEFSSYNKSKSVQPLSALIGNNAVGTLQKKKVVKQQVYDDDDENDDHQDGDNGGDYDDDNDKFKSKQQVNVQLENVGTYPVAPIRGEQLKVASSIKLHKNAVSCLVLSKDHSRIYSVGHDPCGKIYDLVHKQQVRRISEFGDMPLSSAAVCSYSDQQQDSASNSNTLMMVGSWDNKIYVYSVEYGRVIDIINAHDDAVTRLCFNNTNYLLSSSWDATVKLWQCTPNGVSAVPLVTFADHEDSVEAIQFDPSGNLFAVGTSEGAMLVYDVRAKKPVSTSVSIHNEAISQIAFVDSGTLLSCSKDHQVKLSKVNGAQLSSFNSGEPLNCFVSDGDTIITGGDSGLLKMWQLDSGDLLKSYPGHNAAITAIAVATHGQSLVTGAQDGEVILWNTS